MYAHNVCPHSTHTHISETTNDQLVMMKPVIETAAAFCHFTKEFDSVSHKALIDKLQATGLDVMD